MTGIAVLGAAAFLLPSIASAQPIHAAPTASTVQQQLGALALENTQLVEQYDQAQVDFAAKQQAADTASRVADTAQAQYERARGQMSQTVAAQYEGGSFSATGALLSSSDGQSYLDQLATMNVMTAHNAQVLTNLSATRKAAKSAQQRAAALLASAKTKRDDLAKKRTTVQAQVDKYTTMLASLSIEQRSAFQRALDPAASAAAITLAKTSLNSPASARVSKGALIAVKFALAQVGKPYVFGASGPDTFDCSGLTLTAWGKSGVVLPHSAADQYNYGTHVSMSQLQPGDLVFYHRPIGHVTIYIGDGMMVSAPHTGAHVSVVPIAGKDGYVGATRLP